MIMRIASVAVRGPILAVLLAASALVPAVAMAQDAPAAARARGPARMLTVTGTGEISAVPDVAVISSGVESQGETARGALDANSKAVAALIEAARKAGIESRDIATSGFSVQPVYAERRAQPKGEPVQAIVGYQVQNRVTLTLRDVAKVGPLLDQLVTVGSNRIDGITFLVSDANTRRDAARTAAVADARRKAETLAAAAGVELGKVLTIAESDGGPAPRPMMRAMAAEAMGAVPVEAGNATLSSDVEVRFEIVDK